MEEIRAKVRETVWESRIGAVMQTVVAASLLWIGNSIVDMRTELGVLKAQVVTITGQVPAVASLMQDIKNLEYENRDLQRRLDQLESKNGISPRQRQ